MRPKTIALLAALLAASCTSFETDDPDLLSWEEFKAQAYREPDTGVYVTNGDEVAADEADLYAQYERYRAPEVARLEQALIIGQVAGHDERWTAEQAMNLTYCVAHQFGARKAQVLAAMNEATAAWASAARIKFVHVPAEDGNCNPSNRRVVFDVRPINAGSYLARAFSPSMARSRRELVIDNSAFGTITPFTLVGVLRHELGHTLGFRHEHTRPEAGTCFEDNGWRALTTYDSKSVMHYPQCNGSGGGALVLTTRDRSGAASVYGPPAT